MERIAEALDVKHKTVSKDLDGFVPEVQTSRPKGGRPQGASSKRRSGPAPDVEQKSEINALAKLPAEEQEACKKLWTNVAGPSPINSSRSPNEAFGLGQSRQIRRIPLSPFCQTA